MGQLAHIRPRFHPFPAHEANAMPWLKETTAQLTQTTGYMSFLPLDKFFFTGSCGLELTNLGL